MKSFTEILEELNQLDETHRLEAKACRNDLGKSFFETVCAFSNEPDMDGGIIVVGVSQAEDDMFGGYEVTGVSDPDKLSQDIASGCSSHFNHRIRPRIETVNYQDKTVMLVEIPEASPSQKPIFFQAQGLPKGARRRIGSSDQRRDEDDLQIFYQDRSAESFDLMPVKTATLSDIDEDAVAHYRKLLAKARPESEMLAWDDPDLLQAINAVRIINDTLRPTLLGLLLFGTRIALRRELPMVRIDYIRVPGKAWIEDAEQRFQTTMDMRGPSLQLIDRTLATVVEDLPKGFELPEGSVQANTPSLPAKALREAIVNAVMHRSYRIDSPIQIIRYSNRIEISNAGFSLKNEDNWLKPGSELRNKNLAAIFHETNTAETKGTGIGYMRKKMVEAGFLSPAFDSNREANRFTSEFFLHHFLSEDGLDWLAQIKNPLNDGQKYALIVVRDRQKINNRTLRQLTGHDVLAASFDLRKLCELKMLAKMGGGSTTYYVAGKEFPPEVQSKDDTHKGELNPELNPELRGELPQDLKEAIKALGPRPGKAVIPVILKLCRWKALTTSELVKHLGRKRAVSLQRDYLKPLISSGELEYLYPENETHPKQAYRTSNS